MQSERDNHLHHMPFKSAREELMPARGWTNKEVLTKIGQAKNLLHRDSLSLAWAALWLISAGIYIVRERKSVDTLGIEPNTSRILALSNFAL